MIADLASVLIAAINPKNANDQRIFLETIYHF